MFLLRFFWNSLGLSIPDVFFNEEEQESATLLGWILTITRINTRMRLERRGEACVQGRTKICCCAGVTLMWSRSRELHGGRTRQPLIVKGGGVEK